MDQSPLFGVAVALLEVPGAEVLVVSAALQQVVGDDQDGMTDRDCSSTLATPGRQSR